MLKARVKRLERRAQEVAPDQEPWVPAVVPAAMIAKHREVLQGYGETLPPWDGQPMTCEQYLIHVGCGGYRVCRMLADGETFPAAGVGSARWHLDLGRERDQRRRAMTVDEHVAQWAGHPSFPPEELRRYRLELLWRPGDDGDGG